MPDGTTPPALGGPDLLRRDPRPGGSETRLLSTATQAFAPASYDAEAGSVDVVWSTGAAVRRFDFWSGETYDEELDMAGARLDRLQAGGAVLMDHMASIQTLCGSVAPGTVRVQGGQGVATIRFDRSSEEGQAVEAKVAGGHLRHVSIGYRVTAWDKVEAQGKVTRWIARDWEPHEISFVPVPADAGAGTRGARGADSTATIIHHNQEGLMPDIATVPGGPPAAPAIDLAAERAALRAAESARMSGIRAAATGLGMAERADALIAADVTVEEAQRTLIQEVAASRAAAITPAPAAIAVIRDEGDTKRAAMTAAFEHRAGVLRELPEAAREFRGFRMLDFANECVRLAGGNTRGLFPAEIAKLALGSRGMVARSGYGMHTTSDFPNLLANTASKALGSGYGSARRTFTAFGRRRILPDFKSFRVVNLSGAPQLQQIAAVGQEAGEITFGTIGEGAETYQLFRAGRRVPVSFEAIVNDDMDGFSRIPQLFGTAAARLESETVYGIFNANPNMSDGAALFSTGHSNVFGNGVSGFTTGDGVLDVKGLGVGRRVLRTQTAPNGDIIDATPRYLLAPAALEAAALQYTSASYVASAPGNINPFSATLTPVVEPRLASAVQWYLLADNAEVDTIEYAYLEGMEAPEVTTYVDDDTDGVIVKCMHNFGAKATDSRGMVRASGT